MSEERQANDESNLTKDEHLSSLHAQELLMVMEGMSVIQRTNTSCQDN